MTRKGQALMPPKGCDKSAQRQSQGTMKTEYNPNASILHKINFKKGKKYHGRFK